MTDALLSALQKRFPAYAEALPTLLPALEAGEPTLFVLRYRRDLLAGLDDAAFRKIRAGFREERELLRRRGATARALEDAGTLDDEMRHRIDQTRDLALLEDLIRPIREARRAGTKTEDPMTPVAAQILAATPEEPGAPLDEQLAPFCGKDGAHPTVEDQTQRLRHLIADVLGADALRRQAVRNVMRRKGKLVTAAPEGKEPKPRLAPVVGLSEPLSRVKPRTLLMVRRGQKAGALHAHVEIPAEELQALFEGPLAVAPEHPHADLVRAATLDAMERVLLPMGSIEVINERKRIADKALVPSFAETLRERAMAAPAGAMPVVAVAPGATGAARVLAVDAEGRPGRNEAIHPLPPRNEDEAASGVLREIVAETGAKLVAVPASGRASALREWVVKSLDAARELGAHAVLVHEAAAAHLSGSDAGKAAAPELPASARAALSLGRYVQDPLSEIVRYDLTRLALGPNQRDVDQGELRRALDESLEDCVALVGADVNTASVELLARIPGLGPAAAREIAAKRDADGPFASLADLKALESVDEDSWQRAGGFLRIVGGSEPFDATPGHPTGVDIARAIADRVGRTLPELLADPSPVHALEPAEFASEAHTEADVESVLRAIARAGSDPRGVFLPPVSNPGVRRLRDVKEEMELDGVVASIAQFGVFVDLGVHQQGLVHVSELSHTFVEDPSQAVSVGDRVRVKVLKVDVPKRRLSLSVKALLPPPPPSERGRDARAGRGRGRGKGRGRDGGGRRGSASTRHEIPREKDPFHLQLNALRAQLGFEEPKAEAAPKASKPKKSKKQKKAAAAKEAAAGAAGAAAATVAAQDAPAAEVAAPEPAAPETATTEPAAPAEAAPVETAAAEAAPAEAAPVETAPVETAAAETAAAETAPAEEASDAAPEPVAADAPAEEAPAEPAPAETAPAEPAPAETPPEETAPVEPVPAEPVPAEPVPAATAPDETGPAATEEAVASDDAAQEAADQPAPTEAQEATEVTEPEAEDERPTD